jgi:uncharacterized protein
MTRITVTDVRRHPVKSLQGESPAALLLGRAGFAADRRWAVLDAGRPLSAKRAPALLQASAQLDGDAAVLTLPDGSVTRSNARNVDRVLSDWLGRPVELVERADTPWVDLAPVHLLTSSSLAAMAERHEGDWEPRRFRCNLLLDTGDAAELVEQGWIGRRVEVGAAVVEVVEPTGRCAMTTMAQPGIAEDRGILRTLARDNDASLGVYARVLQPGLVHPGDAVHLC